MDSLGRLYLCRAEDEFLLAETILRLSTEQRLKQLHGIPQDKTFFNAVITHAYYGIFYCAKAYLLSKGVWTRPPEEHRKTYESFARFVESGKLDRELLVLYEDAMEKAETLLDIFLREKKKRGFFTYNIKSQANVPYAKASIANAKTFIASLKAVLEPEK